MKCKKFRRFYVLFFIYALFLIGAEDRLLVSLKLLTWVELFLHRWNSLKTLYLCEVFFYRRYAKQCPSIFSNFQVLCCILKFFRFWTAFWSYAVLSTLYGIVSQAYFQILRFWTAFWSCSGFELHSEVSQVLNCILKFLRFWTAFWSSSRFELHSEVMQFYQRYTG